MHGKSSYPKGQPLFSCMKSGMTDLAGHIACSNRLTAGTEMNKIFGVFDCTASAVMELHGLGIAKIIRSHSRCSYCERKGCQHSQGNFLKHDKLLPDASLFHASVRTICSTPKSKILFHLVYTLNFSTCFLRFSAP